MSPGRRALAHPPAPAWPAWTAWGLWSFLIFFLSAIPGQEWPEGPRIPGADKIVHAGLWSAWSTFAFFAFARQFPRLRAHQLLALTAGLAALGGALDEFHQAFVPNRSPDPADWLADVIAAILTALLLGHILPWVRSARWSDLRRAPSSPNS